MKHWNGYISSEYLSENQEDNFNQDLENADNPYYQLISTQSPQASPESSAGIDRNADLRFDRLPGQTTEVTKIVMIFQI